MTSWNAGLAVEHPPTQEGVLYTDSFRLQKRVKSSRAFGGVLRETTIEALAHVGEHAFHDAAAAAAFAALFLRAKAEPPPEHRLTAFRLVGPKSPEEKDALLREAIGTLAFEAGRGEASVEVRP